MFGTFTYSHRKKSNGIRFGDRAGHSVGPRLPSPQFENILLGYCQTLIE